MPRLPRPRIPLKTRCLVALRQLGEFWPSAALEAGDRVSYGALLEKLLERLSEALVCLPADLDLDHDPPLGARQKTFNEAGEHVGYIPPANDPHYLSYRERAAHRIKTNVRGDGAQRPDRVLIRRNRKLERPTKPKFKKKIPSRPFPKGRKFQKPPKQKDRP